MKIICPGHHALIDIPEKELHAAFQAQLKSIIFTCPFCAEEVLISDIRVDMIYDKLEKVHPK